jgi:hypothetical protein
MKKNESIKTAITICVLSLTLSLASPARTIYVDDDVPGDFKTIQAAIDDANNGDTVIIKPGSYTGLGNRDIDFKGKAITVTGTDPNDWDVVRRTVVDCQGTEKEPHRGFLFTTGEGPNSVLSGVTITGGYAPKISLEVFKEFVGGGICCNKSGPTILHCIVSESFAYHGGGGLFAYNGKPTIRHCEFRSNGNSIVGAGGVELWGGQPVVTNCLVTGNYGDSCGGIYCEYASALVLQNCLISGNESSYYGAGVNINGVGDVRIINCTIVLNRDEQGAWGAGLYLINGPKALRLTNCILWGNSSRGTRSQQAQVSLSSSNRLDYCCIEGWEGKLTGVGSFGKDPLLTRDAHLQPDSPCIDAGDPNSSGVRTARDIDGETRVYGLRADIGCDEFTDTDGDDLSDVWERRYFADLASAAGTDNPDGDAWDNKSEYIRSSNPLHPPTVYYVDPVRGNDGWDGLSTSREGAHGPKATIQAAMDQAEAHDLDRIVLTPGLYTGDGNRNIDFGGKEVTIRSIDPNDPAVVAATIIDCNGVHPITTSTSGQSQLTEMESRRAFVLQSGEGPDAGIEGLTIINGSAANAGGAVLCEWSSPRIVNCTLRNNESAASGGAIDCRNGNPAIERCTLEENRANYGGAIACYSLDGHTHVTNCTIRANVAVISGGGLSCSYGTQAIGCLITANEAQGRNPWGYTALGGGGVMLGGDGAVLANCTISGNIAMLGSGLGTGCTSDTQGVATLYNCIVWGNSGAEENQIMFSICCPMCERSSEPVAVRARHSCIQGPGEPPANGYYTPLTYIDDANSIHADPRFVSPETGDYHLRADSPCIDAGSSSLPVRLAATDLAGTARLVDFDGDGVAQVDMGAYELSSSDGMFLIPSSWNVRFHAYDSAPSTELQALVIRNSGSGRLRWMVDCNCLWLEVSPASGEPGTEITLCANGEGLLPGIYNCRFLVQSPSAANSPLAVPVELQVGRTLRVPESYATIQAAVDAAGSGDMIVLADGTYAGVGNRDITVPAKTLWIRSEHGPQACIIDGKDPDGKTYSGFTMTQAGSDIVCEGLTLSGGGYAFQIRNGRMRLVNCHAVGFKYGFDAAASHVTIDACRFSDGGTAVNVVACDVKVLDSVAARNAVGMDFGSSQVVVYSTEISQSTVRGISMSSCFEVVLDHCLISGNGSTSYGYQAIDFRDTQPIIRNCTLVGNMSWWDRGRGSPTSSDAPEEGRIVNSIFWSNGYSTDNLLSQCEVEFSDVEGGWPGEGNIDADPLFVSPGNWDAGAGTGLRSSAWTHGDYHLKSQTGRWEPGSGSWVIDDVTSPCIDAGEPNSAVGDEPQPNGGRINMGAYGGTAEASKSYSGG